MISTVTNLVQTYVGNAGLLPFGVAVADTPTGPRVFVSDFGNGSGHALTRIDVATDTFLGQLAVHPKPRGIAATPDGTRVFIAAFGINKIDVVDTTQ